MTVHEWIQDNYDWLKAFHIMAVIAWMAGMLYLPRLFVYHCEAPAGSQQSETFKVMERRLLKGIINPSMGAVWILVEIVLAIVWAASDGFDAHGWAVATTWLTAAYVISRGIAKASRVLEH